MTDDKNKRKLYDALSQDYDMGSFEQFSQDVEDEGKRRKLYDAIIEEYDLPDFDGFTRQLIGGQPGVLTGNSQSSQSSGNSRNNQEVVVQNGGNDDGSPYRLAQPYAPVYDFGGELPAARRTATGTGESKAEGDISQEKPKETPNDEVQEQPAPLGPEKFAQAMQVQQEVGQMQQEMGQMQADFAKRLGNIRSNNQPFGKPTDVLAPARKAIAQKEAEEQAQKDIELATMEMRQSNAAARQTWAAALGRAGEQWRFGRPISNEAARLKETDIDRLMDEAWERMDGGLKERSIKKVSSVLVEDYGMRRDVARKMAERVVRGESDRMMYEQAVEGNMPRSWAEHILNKVNGNTIGTLLEGWARAKASTIGDLQARDEASQAYGKEHRLADIIGGVGSVALDPFTYMAGGLGGAAGKAVGAATKAVVKKMAMKRGLKAMGRMMKAGNVAQGMAAGATNLAAFEAMGESANQVKYGGKVKVDEASGRYVVESYDAGEILSAAGRGSLIGVGTGAASTMIGNVGDKIYERVGSTAGKIGVRAGQTATSIAVEGTIFALPEFMKGEGDWDSWLESVEMMAGFKVHGAVMSIPQTLAKLKKNPESRARFETRLRSMLDGEPSLLLTDDEIAELEQNGYGDLVGLVNGYKSEREALEKGLPIAVNSDGHVPYNRFQELMEDKDISEAARAKMHYYVSGHKLPMSTVIGTTLTEQFDEKGNNTGYTVEAFGVDGHVIVSRRYKSLKEAEVARDRYERQAELNGIKMAEEVHDQLRAKKGHSITAKKVRAEISKTLYSDENGRLVRVDIDKALGKEPNRRSAVEIKAIEDYLRRLAEVYEKDVSFQPERQLQDGNPTSEGATEAVSEPVDEVGVDIDVAFERGHGADEQGRRDIALELAMADESNREERQAAWDGVRQRIEEEADEAATAEREAMRQQEHKDGTIRRVTLKEQGEDGKDKEAYVVDGKLVMMADGTMVDPEASDRTVVIYDPATGERRMIDPTSDMGVLTADEPVAMAAVEAEIASRREARVRAGLDAASGKVSVQAGQSIQLPDGRGVVVMSEPDEDGVFMVQTSDGAQMPVKIQDVQKVADEVAMADYMQRHAENNLNSLNSQSSQTERPEGFVEGVPEEYVPGMELTIKDYDGQEKRAVVTGRGRMWVGEGGRMSYEADGTGNVIEYVVEGESEPRHDHKDKLNVRKMVVGYMQPESREVGDGSQQESHEVEQPNQSEERDMEQGDLKAATPDNATSNNATPDNATSNNATPTEESAEFVMPMREDGEPDFMATTPQQGHKYLYEKAGLSREEASQFVNANIEAAEKELKKLQGKAPKMGTSLAKYQQAKAKHQQQLDEAQRVLDYWNGVKAEQQRVVMAEARARAERDAAAHEAAVAAEQVRQAEEIAKRQEQAERGANAVHPAIREKWNAAPKVEGMENEITLPNGEKIRGHYVLTESGAATPSHNPNMEFVRNEGFPVDENGQTVNDRDYERDQEAQRVTRDMADRYDGRAIQSVPVVSLDGVVLSGNGRTMAGELAAQQNSDGEYIEHLKKYPQQFGFTAEQVESMQHPRVLFVADEEMPYTTETFAKFNAQDMKSQSRVEQAVKLGKMVDDATFARVVSSINRFDTLGDFYNDPKAAPTAIGDLYKAGAINQMQLAEMMDGEKVSGAGRQMLENMLIGKAFENNPDAIRQLSEYPAMRQNVVSALAEVANNANLDEAYSLAEELSQAIGLAYEARKSGIDAGKKVSQYARQQNLFPFDGGETVADYRNLSVMMLADLINDSRTNQLKKTLALYNDKAAMSAAGQTDIFSGGVRSKVDILKEVFNILGYGTKKEQEEALAGAVERRKAAASVSEDGDVARSDAGGGTRNDDGRGSNGSTIERGEGEEIDENGRPFVKAADGTTIFGEIREESGLTPAPIKLSEGYQDENGKGYGLAHIEANHGSQIREAGFASVEDFVSFVAQNYDEDNIRVGKHRINGSTSYLIQVTDKYDNTLFIELSRDGSYWNVNSGGIFRKGYANKKETVVKTEPQQPNDAVSSGSSLSAGETSGISSAEPTGEPTVSERKDTKKTETEQENVVSAIKSAEAEVNTEPTEGQKRAGNYKMGHVVVDGYEVTIENPKGSVRSGVDLNGKAWSQEMHNTYGYIRGTEGVDGDHIDVFLSDDPTQGNVYVVDQVDTQTGEFDEHKVMYGFPDIESARRAYLSNYEEGWRGLGAITAVSKEEFKKWIESSHRKTKPFKDYVSVNTLGDVQIGEGKSGIEDVDAFIDEMGSVDEWYRREGGKEPEVGDDGEYLPNPEFEAALHAYYALGDRVYDAVSGLSTNDLLRIHKEARERGMHAIEAHVEGELWKRKNEGLARPKGRDTKQPSESGEVPAMGGEQLIRGEKWDSTKTPERNKRISKRADRYDVSYQIGTNRTMYGMKKADSDLLHDLLEKYNDDLVAIWNAYERGDILMFEDMASGLKAMIEYEQKHGKSSAGVNSKTWLATGGGGAKQAKEQKAGAEVSAVSEREAELRDALVETMRGAGIEVSEDVEEGQAVLDEVNGRADAMSRGKMSEKQQEREQSNYNVDFATAFVTGKTLSEARRERVEREEKRREAAKEVYEIILSGEYNDVTLQKISDYIDDVTPRNPYGRRLSERLPQRVERALYERERSSAIDALFSRASESAVAANERVGASGRRAVAEKKKELVEKWAKASGNWHTDLKDFTDNTEAVSEGTADSDVYLSNDGQHVIKLSRGKHDKRFGTDIDAVTLFNYVFPNSAYRLLGYGDMGKGFVTVLEQPYVDFNNSEPLTEAERVEYMKRLGFRPLNKENTAFSNGEIVVSDLQGNNIVRDANGNIRVIDADCKLHTKDVGGEYAYPPVEHDMPRGGVREHRVYHGSGVDFEAFDHSHMGEGEGAQAYGWGTYVTEVEGIGRAYAKSNAGKGPDDKYREISENRTAYLRLVWDFNHTDDVAEKRRINAEMKQLSDKHDRLQAELNELEKKRGRFIYTVEIPDDNGSNYLEWDGRVSDEQYPMWYEAMKMLGEQDGFAAPEQIVPSKDGFSGISVSHEVGYLGRKHTPQKVSEALKSAGFVGVKYPAEFRSGGREDGAKNYVIFDEKDLQITDKLKFFKTGDGQAYGYTYRGKIYIDPRIATAETPIHEYTHLWSEALRHANPEAWERLKSLLQEDEELMDMVRKRYAGLEGDELMDEVFAHYSGRRGAERLRAEQEQMMKENKEGLLGVAKITALFNRLRSLLSEYWNKARQLFAGNNKHLDEMSAEDFADMALSDLLHGVNPKAEMEKHRADSHKTAQLREVVGKNPMEDSYHRGIRSIGDIKTMDEAVAEREREVAELGEEEPLSAYPDVSDAMLREAQRSGRIRVYSSKPIENGAFVTPSRMQAEEYAGGGRVYSAEVDTKDVAWMDVDEGQMAKRRTDIRYSTVYGGNSGYVGYSKSKRAVGAENRGLRNKSQMDNDFAEEVNALLAEKMKDAPKVTLKQIKEALSSIKADEWHHTSKYGNKTDYYSADNIAEYFAKEFDPEEQQRRQAEQQRQWELERLEDEQRKLQNKIDELQSKREDKIMEALPQEEVTLPNGEKELYFVTSTGDKVLRTRYGADSRLFIPCGWDVPADREWKREHYDEVRRAMDEYNNARKVVSTEYDEQLRELYKENAEQDKRILNLRYGINEDIRYHMEGEETRDVEAVNARFNEELKRQKEGTLPEGHIYDMGMPGAVLLSTGFPNVPIEMSASHLAEKANVAHHPFDIAEMKGLVEALQSPLAVFSYGDKGKAQNAIVEIQHDGKNFVVGIHFNQERRGIVVNDIRGLYPKDNAEWLNWIQQGKTLYVDKEKIQDLIDQQRRILAEVDYLDLNLITKIVKEFKNPEINLQDTDNLNGRNAKTEAIRERVEAMSERLGTQVRVVDDVESITHEDAKAQVRRRKSKGWYDPRTGEVVIVLPNAESVEDVAATVAHEVIGHKGLRELVGQERYGSFLDEVYGHLREELKSGIDEAAGRDFIDGLGSRSYEESRRRAVDELLARLAEKPFEEMNEGERTLWQKISDVVRKILDKFLGTLKLPKWFKLGDNELRYMLWRSKENLERGKENYVDMARDAAKRSELGLTEEPSEDVLFREGETEDIWQDGSLGMAERITLAKVRLSAAHAEDMKLRDEARRTIAKNLMDLHRAMGAQREFDRSTTKRVADLARVLIGSGYMGEMSGGEVKRLLSAVKNATGAKEIGEHVQKVMDIMVDNVLKRSERQLEQLEKVRGEKVDAKGVQVQGTLDAAGQTQMRAFKDWRKESLKDIDAEIERAYEALGSENEAIAEEAGNRLVGLQWARQYADDIKGSKLEEKRLRQELEDYKAEYHSKGTHTKEEREAYRQAVAEMEAGIREERVKRAEAYGALMSRMIAGVRESVERAQEWKESERARVREIHHNANSDLEGKPCDEHYEPDWKAKVMNSSVMQFFMAPLMTFEQMMRQFGSKSADGAGYLYNRFMRGWTDARQKEIRGYREKLKTIDEKVAELFGEGDDKVKAKSIGELMRKMSRLPKVSVSFMNGGKMQDKTLEQGNLMYIYMANKMSDGRMKLRKMGITEEAMQTIEEALDPRVRELADWVQEEFLPKSRNEYNETHKRLFGASMAAVEHYFPLKILKSGRHESAEELDAPDESEGISTATGAIKKRVRNTLPLDVLGADALHVLLDHVAEMEHWNAFAEFSRDVNTLRTYTRFKNKVRNMTTIYGSGDLLWKKFNAVCQMATGSYRPPKAMLDKTAVNVAKGVTAAKVSLRLNTALKQLLSAPAYASEVSVGAIAKSMATPWDSWNWCMENLPIFEERWTSRASGDPRLLKTDKDWQSWRSNVVQMASRIGMAPNAFVDALTVSIGAKAIYDTCYNRYIKEGYSAERAHAKAVQDAEIAYNLTQQSSEGAVTSTMQVDRSWLSVMLTVFRNSPMSYGRQMVNAARNLAHDVRDLKRENYKERIEFMKKQYMRDGIEDEAQAEKNAKAKYRRQIRKDAIALAVFGFGLQLAWNIGGHAWALLFGDDDDDKDERWDDIWTHTAMGWTEGFTGGDLISQGGGYLLNEWLNDRDPNFEYLQKDMPLSSDMGMILRELGSDQVAALNDIVGLAVQAGVGVNPETLTDVVAALLDACGDDPELTKEGLLFTMRVLQVPQSQIKSVYYDEVGLTGTEASKYTPQQLAERYAEYQVKRGRMLTPWAWDDAEALEKQTKKEQRTVKERTERRLEKIANEKYARYEERAKEIKDEIIEANQMEDMEERAARYNEIRGYEDYEACRWFEPLDANLEEMAKRYLQSKSAEEARMNWEVMARYKEKMVEVLDEQDAVKRQEKINELVQEYIDYILRYKREPTIREPKEMEREKGKKAS